MFEQEPEQRSTAGSVFATLGGVLGGLLLGIVIPVAVLSMVIKALARVAPKASFAVAEVLNLSVLFLIGYRAYRNMHDSPAARGLLIGISIAFLLNAICGVGVLVWR